MWTPPVLVACIPEMIVVRDGAHTGLFDHARLKSMPFAASASTLGVRAFTSP
jgi:hypothetical protein